jgi:hypothetical protein
MPIQLHDLRSASSRYNTMTHIVNFNEALACSKRTAFLCHSHKDKDLVEGLQVLLSENGMELYVDWQDHEMPDSPNKKTADYIKLRITVFDWFFFLATPNSTQSRWCPWEIGIADCKKEADKIFIIPTTDYSGNWYGNEYLQLYQQITKTKDGRLAIFQPGQNSNGIYIRDLR